MKVFGNIPVWKKGVVFVSLFTLFSVKFLRISGDTAAISPRNWGIDKIFQSRRLPLPKKKSLLFACMVPSVKT